MTWQSGLPRVATIAQRPCSVTPRNWWGCLAARTASMAIWTPPSVPFLKPTGIESPEASSRCTWLSVVRAPMAPQATRSEVNWPELGEVEQEAARQPEPFVDGEAPVEAGVVDEPLPAHGRPRLLEVDAHHDTEIARVLVPHGREPPCVVEGSGRVVDRTRADDDDEPIVFAPEDAADLLARSGDGHGTPIAQRLLLEQDQRRQERPEALDAQVAGAFRHGAQCTREAAPDQRPRHVTLRPAVDRLSVLERIQRKVLWLGTYMVHHANSLRPNLDGVKVGGHQASSSSVVSLLTALYFDALRSDDLVAVKAHASPAFYAIQYLRGRLTAGALHELRSFGGLQAYPSRRKNADIVDLSTGSMGLGAVQATFGAFASRYIVDHVGGRSRGRVVVMVGDAELDEGNVGEALAEEAVGRLANVLWIVDVNRQSLDRIVPDGRLSQVRAM